MPDADLVSGTAMLELIEAYLRGFEPLGDYVKVTIVDGEAMRAITLRCHVIERLADILADHAKLAVLAHQHDAVLVIGNVVLLGGDVAWLKQHDEQGREIDITTWKDTIEVKNGVDIGPRDVGMLVGEHFDDMVTMKTSKSKWWLCYFTKRPKPKGKLGDACMYFLNIVEITTAGLVNAEACRESTRAEAMRVSEELEKQVMDEDEVDEGFLVPVRNIWIVDKLRAERDQAMQQLDEATKERDEATKERDEAMKKLGEDQATIAELKRRLGEE